MFFHYNKIQHNPRLALRALSEKTLQNTRLRSTRYELWGYVASVGAESRQRRLRYILLSTLDFREETLGTQEHLYGRQ